MKPNAQTSAEPSTATAHATATAASAPGNASPRTPEPASSSTLQALLERRTAAPTASDSPSVPEANAPEDDAPEPEIVLHAQQKITLQCGLSSITLHPNGKIVLRGQSILSVAEGTQRIVGGQIEFN